MESVGKQTHQHCQQDLQASQLRRIKQAASHLAEVHDAESVGKLRLIGYQTQQRACLTNIAGSM